MWKRVISRGSFAVVVLALMGASSLAFAQGPGHGHGHDEDEADEPICRSISASLSATFYTEGCDSPVGMCTAGDLLQRGRRVVGQTNYVADGVGGGAIGEDSIVFPPVEPGSTWSYAGVLRLITPLGEVQSSDIGVFDTAGGSFTELNRVTGGTGIFEGATGTFFINGTSFPDGSGFEADITGEVCVTSRRAAGQLRWVFLP
ncbi:hypothetical protein DL240_16010 [Lujinxingia litoralis]|uniref:Allene oxide cyclase barrel-like domain-containing protein n=1 Tax=Lujinxingia litoralis TaxID=2211119 RepID=A0A328C292_9DELT|nr:hypothetical protein [Lujinxingia litoralis]RAL20544.1 hypothetical protein DL240_16010 [Lujinxingia litoralis]